MLLVGILLSGPQPASGQIMAMARQQSRTAGGAPTVAAHRLADALNELKSRYRADILFEDRTVANLTVAADALAGTTSLEGALGRLLKPFNLRYKQVKPGTWVVLARKSSASANEARFPVPAESGSGPMEAGAPVNENTTTGLIAAAAERPADITVTGTVTGADNNAPLPGVSVIVKGTSRGTTTDAQGRYSLRIPEPAGSVVLVFSYVGYLAQEVPLSKRSELNVQLKEDNQSLNEVVVVGYGTVRKSDLTGSVTSLKAQET